jgi:hypothetical protein
MASRANIYVDQSTDFRISVGISGTDGSALPIDTYDFFASMKKMYSTSTVANFNVEKDVPNSSITLVLTDLDTASLVPGKYQYDVLMRKQSGEISKVVEGLAIVVPTISGVI